MAATRSGAGVRPPTVDLATAAWHDASHAVREMRAVAGISFLLMVALSALETAADAYSFPGERGGWSQRVVGVVFAVAQCLVAAPLAIAVQRYVLLNETTQGYSLDFSNPRLLRFFAVVVMFYLALLLPLGILPASIESGWGILASVVLFFVVAIAALRSVMIFPAIAVDAPGASLGNALLDSKEHAWPMAWMVLIAAAPIFVTVIVGIVLMVWLPGWAENVIVVAIDSVLTFLVITGMAAAVSHLYASYGDRLGRPRNLRPAGSAAN